MASARSRTTDCGCCCTVECHGKLHLPHECGAAPPAWPRRTPLPPPPDLTHPPSGQHTPPEPDAVRDYELRCVAWECEDVATPTAAPPAARPTTSATAGITSLCTMASPWLGCRGFGAMGGLGAPAGRTVQHSRWATASSPFRCWSVLRCFLAPNMFDVAADRRKRGLTDKRRVRDHLIGVHDVADSVEGSLAGHDEIA